MIFAHFWRYRRGILPRRHEAGIRHTLQHAHARHGRAATGHPGRRAPYCTSLIPTPCHESRFPHSKHTLTLTPPGLHPPVDLRALDGRARRADDLPERGACGHETVPLLLRLCADREPRELPVGADRLQWVPPGRRRGGAGAVRRHGDHLAAREGTSAYLGRLCM